ncbi:hypothetical protein FGO68_gene11639 [Halteria grandinella]|uniref:Uncharacterized protein n=1 Tax=Halteria grandinella TaxID=5974 RepID=A0A8J8NXX2_HALGN|nr:hypothetical protein FGO68_gene11639 [Halteria grandinella]
MLEIAKTQFKIQALDKQSHSYIDTQQSVAKYFAPLAKPRLIAKVGDRQLLKGEKIYVRDPARFVRNEDPPGKGNVAGEVNEMMMNPEKFEKKKGLTEDVEEKPSSPIITQIAKAVFTTNSTLGAFIHNDQSMILGSTMLDNSTQEPPPINPYKDKLQKALSFKLSPGQLLPAATPAPIIEPLQNQRSFVSAFKDSLYNRANEDSLLQNISIDEEQEKLIERAKSVLRDYLDSDPERMDIYYGKARYMKQAQAVGSTTNRSQSTNTHYKVMSMTSRPGINAAKDTLQTKSAYPSKENQETAATNPTQVTLPCDESSINQGTSALNTLRDRGSPTLESQSHSKSNTKSIFHQLQQPQSHLDRNRFFQETPIKSRGYQNDQDRSLVLPTLHGGINNTVSFSMLQNTPASGGNKQQKPSMKVEDHAININAINQKDTKRSRPLVLNTKPVIAHDDQQTFGTNGFDIPGQGDLMGAKYKSEKKLQKDGATTPMERVNQIVNLTQKVKRLDSIPNSEMGNQFSPLGDTSNDTITFYRKTKSPFIKKTERLLSNRGTDYDYASFKMSLHEEQTSKRLIKKANMLKNNVTGGFVNRRKTQLLGFKLMQVLQTEGEEYLLAKMNSQTQKVMDITEKKGFGREISKMRQRESELGQTSEETERAVSVATQ